MATKQPTEKAATGRLVYLIALPSVVMVAAVAFGRVYQGRGASLRLGLAAGAAVLLAMALERRNVALSGLVSAAALIVAVGLLIFPHTTKYLLPTATTLRAARHAWAAVGRQAAVQTAPTLPLPPLMLAGLTAVWAASFATHTLAVRARSPFLAIVPPAALMGFTSQVVSDGARPLYVLAFLVAALMLLFGDSLRRVGQWGPVSFWGRGTLAMSTSTRAARRVASIALLVALFAPGLLPGFRSPPLLDVQSGSAQHISINPIVDLKPALLSQSSGALFTVKSREASYWRFVTLDTFNGRLWTAQNLDGSNGKSVEVGPLPGATDLHPPGARLLDQHFTFDRLSQPWLPAAPDPVSVQLPEQAKYDQAAAQLVAPNGTSTGYRYEVVSRTVTPAPEILKGFTSLDSAEARRYLALPDLPPEVAQIAHKLADAAPTPYEKVLAIQSYLRTFRYDERVPAGHDVNDILYFLTTTHAGFCEQFAGSMAVLLRTLGIPARVAVGFTPGQYDSRNDLFRVSAKNAHAWVEVLFPQYGWLAFEPTPTRANPEARAYDFPVTLTRGISSTGCQTRPIPGGGPLIPDCRTKTTTATPGPGGAIPPPPGGEPKTGTANLPGSSTSHTWRWWAGVGGLGLLVLLALGLPLGKAARRRRRLARATEPHELVLAAYQLFADQAGDLGWVRRPWETMWEYRTRLRGGVEFSDGDVDRLMVLAGRVAYSERDISSGEAEEAVESARRALHDVGETAGTGRRLLGLYRVWLPRREWRGPG
jgi:hypothetical protein